MNLIKAITFMLCSTLLVGQTTPIRNPQIQGASGSIVSGATLTNSGTFTNSGTLGGAGTFDLSSGTVTMPATQILTNVTLNGTITFADNIKQTFNPGATYVGINVGSYAGVPSTLANGDLWYDSTANALKARINGAIVSLGAGGGGSSTLDTLTDVNLTSLADVDFLRYDSGTSKWINRTPANVRTDLSLGAAALLGTSTGGNGTADNGKVLVFDTGGHFHATTSISVNNTSGTITAQFRPDSLLLNSTGSGSHTINGSATGARTHSFLDESGTLAHTATTLAGYGITDAQPLDATLTALAALNNTKGVLAQTGSDTFTRLQTPVNVKVYGATGDARKVTDGVANGTTTVTSATANFTAADVGKIIWATDTSGATLFSGRTIASVTNSTDIVISGAALGTVAGMQMVWGTDDTAAIQAAAAAADAMSPKGCVEVPSGGYIFSDVLFSQVYASGTDTYAVRGDGSISTVFFPTPDHALTNSAIFNYNSNAAKGRFSGFAIDGIDITYAGSPFATQASSESIWTDVTVKHIRGCSSLTYTTGARFITCRWEFASYVGVLVNGLVSFYDCYSGNHGYIPLQIGSSGAVIWEMGIMDESGGPSIYNEGDVKINNAIVYAGGNQNACQMAGTSTLRSVNTQFVPYASNNNVTGLLVASGCTARLVNCILTGSGTGYGLNNSGTVYDVGGNTFTTTTGTAPVDALSSVVSVAHGGTGITSFGTGVSTALAVNVGSAGAFVTFNGALGTPSSGTATNLTGTASGLTAGAATTLATARTINGVSFDGSANVADYATDSAGTDTYAITLSPAPAAYITNAHYRFIAGTANTGACTININSLGAKTIKKAAGGITTDLADNDIRSGQAVDLVYDGTNMQMQSTLGNAGGGVGGSTGQVQLNNGSGALAGTNTSATATELNGTNGVSDFSEAFKIVMPTYARTVMSVTAAGGVSWPQGIGESSSGFLVSAGNDIGYTGTKVSFGSGGPGDTQLSRIAAAELQLNNRSGGGAILEFIQVAALGTASANSARIGVIDVAGTAEVAVKDEAGNQTQISPHARDSPGAAIDDGTSAALPVVIKHSNEYLGTEEWIHLSALAKAVEKLTGEKFVFSRDLPPAKKKDWATVQAEQVAASEANRAEAIARRDAELPKLAAERAKAKNDATRAEIDKRKAELEKLPPVLQAKPAPEFLRPKKE